jgi:hypothetical protein
LFARGNARRASEWRGCWNSSEGENSDAAPVVSPRLASEPPRARHLRACLVCLGCGHIPKARACPPDRSRRAGSVRRQSHRGRIG